MSLPTDEEWKKYIEGLLHNKKFMGLAYKLKILKRKK